MFRNSRRGATLVELTVASAVGAITLLATLSVFNATRASQDSSDKLITSYQSLNMALLSMTRHLENVGYRFPGQSLQLRNNVTEGMTFSMGPGGGEDLAVVNEGASTAGIIAGTDVIDFFVGDPNRRVGTVASVSLSGLFHLITLDGGDAPVTDLEKNTLLAGAVEGPLMVFSDGTLSCLGLVDSRLAGTAGIVQYKVRTHDFAGPHPTGVSNCPAPGMNSYGIGQRRRYMVYQEARGQNVGLYTQISQASVTGFQNAGTLGPPVLLARGVDDLQIAPSMDNTDNQLGCGNSLLCQCGRGNVQCLTSYFDLTQLYRGVRVRLVSRGLHPIRQKGARRPNSFDRSAATDSDGIQRQIMEGFVDFPNMTPVLVTPM